MQLFQLFYKWALQVESKRFRTFTIKSCGQFRYVSAIKVFMNHWFPWMRHLFFNLKLFISGLVRIIS